MNLLLSAPCSNVRSTDASSERTCAHQLSRHRLGIHSSADAAGRPSPCLPHAHTVCCAFVRSKTDGCARVHVVCRCTAPVCACV